MDTIPVTSPPAQFERCETCDAPVDREQRYCVACGTHRRAVADPAARYLALASARARSARAGSRPGARRRRQAPSSLVTALVLAVIPVAVAIGVLVGHSGSSNAEALKQALRSYHPSTVTENVAATNSGSTGTTGTTGSTTSHGKKHHHGAASSASRSTPKTVKTKYGSATQITGAHATKSQEKQGETAAKKDQSAKGKSYVSGQSSLPGTVVIP